MKSLEGACCGRIKDVYFNDDTWQVTHLLISLVPGSSARSEVLARPEHALRIDDHGASLQLLLNHAEIYELPPASSELPVCKQYAAMAFSSRSNPHLRTAKAVSHYRINVRGEFGGTLEDLIFDEASWQIRYLAIEQAIGQKKLRFHILPQRVERFTWATQRVILRELEPVCLDGGEVRSDLFTAA